MEQYPKDIRPRAGKREDVGSPAWKQNPTKAWRSSAGS